MFAYIVGRPRPRRGHRMAIAGGRRVRVVWRGDWPGYVVTWTGSCSGCEGAGCDECGYHGRRRRREWVPLYYCPTCGTARQRESVASVCRWCPRLAPTEAAL